MNRKQKSLLAAGMFCTCVLADGLKFADEARIAAALAGLLCTLAAGMLEWKKRRRTFLHEKQGLLLIGDRGCLLSSVLRAYASEWKAPLLIAEIGKNMQPKEWSAVLEHARRQHSLLCIDLSGISEQLSRIPVLEPVLKFIESWDEQSFCCVIVYCEDGWILRETHIQNSRLYGRRQLLRQPLAAERADILLQCLGSLADPTQTGQLISDSFGWSHEQTTRYGKKLAQRLKTEEFETARREILRDLTQQEQYPAFQAEDRRAMARHLALHTLARQCVFPDKALSDLYLLSHPENKCPFQQDIIWEEVCKDHKKLQQWGVVFQAALCKEDDFPVWDLWLRQDKEIFERIEQAYAALIPRRAAEFKALCRKEAEEIVTLQKKAVEALSGQLSEKEFLSIQQIHAILLGTMVSFPAGKSTAGRSRHSSLAKRADKVLPAKREDRRSLPAGTISSDLSIENGKRVRHEEQIVRLESGEPEAIVSVNGHNLYPERVQVEEYDRQAESERKAKEKEDLFAGADAIARQKSQQKQPVWECPEADEIPSSMSELFDESSAGSFHQDQNQLSARDETKELYENGDLENSLNTNTANDAVEEPASLPQRETAADMPELEEYEIPDPEIPDIGDEEIESPEFPEDIDAFPAMEDNELPEAADWDALDKERPDQDALSGSSAQTNIFDLWKKMKDGDPSEDMY